MRALASPRKADSLPSGGTHGRSGRARCDGDRIMRNGRSLLRAELWC